MKIKLENIPNNLEKILEEDNILIYSTGDFDKAMLENKLFSYGGSKRAHRIVSQKAKDLGYYGVVEVLTGLPKELIIFKEKEMYKNKQIEKMFMIAVETGYTIIEKDLQKYIDYGVKRRK